MERGKGIREKERRKLKIETMLFKLGFLCVVVLLLAGNANGDNCPLLQCQCNEEKETIDCSQRNLANIPKITQTMSTRWKMLNLSGNSITSLDQSDFEQFQTGSIESIDLRRNPLTYGQIHPSAMSSIGHSLKSLSIGSSLEISDRMPNEDSLEFLTTLPNLQVLHIDGWKLNNVNGKYWYNLREIQLERCQIYDFRENAFENVAQTLEQISINNEQYLAVFTYKNVFASLSKLQVLKITQTSISSFYDMFLPNHIEQLVLSRNKIQHLGTLASNSLELLDVSHNNLETVTDLGPFLPNLRELHMENCNMNAPPKNYFLMNLKTVNFGYNKLAKFESSSDTIVQLSLAGNQITTELGSIFKNMPNLQSLDLSSNNIAKVGKLDLQQKSDISILLKDNSIESVEELLEMNQQSTLTLDISGNPVWCNCSTLDLIKTNTLLKIEGHCQQPSGMKGIELKMAPQQSEMLQCTNSMASRNSVSDAMAIAGFVVLGLILIVILVGIVAFVIWRRRRQQTWYNSPEVGPFQLETIEEGPANGGNASGVYSDLPEENATYMVPTPPPRTDLLRPEALLRPPLPGETYI